MTEDLTARLAGLKRAMAAPLPSPEELADGNAEDRAMAERICKARPGVPLHHAYAALETLRTLQRVDTAKEAPTAHQCDDECVCPLDGKPLIYWPAGNQHACQDPDCPNAHGVLPALTAEDAVEAMQDMAGDLYTAENRLAFVREMCDLADREQRQVTTEQVRAWTNYNGCGGAIVLPEEDQAALQEQDGADSYAAMVNAPLRPETIQALRERLASGDYPVRKVRARVRNMGREPAVLAIPDDELEPLLALAEDAPEPGEVHKQAGGLNGAEAWMWRCNGTQWCDGWIGLNLGSETAARAEYERHDRENHHDQPTEKQLHRRMACPGWEYATTEGPRKQWDHADQPPSDDNGDPDTSWERNVDAGREGWERFDYTEESYWRRRTVSGPA